MSPWYPLMVTSCISQGFLWLSVQGHKRAVEKQKDRQGGFCLFLLQEKNIIRDGGSAAILPTYTVFTVNTCYTVFTVNTIYTVFTVKTIYTVFTVYTIYTLFNVKTIYTVFTVKTIYTVFTVNTIYTVFTVNTIYTV